LGYLVKTLLAFLVDGNLESTTTYQSKIFSDEWEHIHTIFEAGLDGYSKFKYRSNHFNRFPWLKFVFPEEFIEIKDLIFVVVGEE
jgi:hypothetical protein